MTGSFKLIVRQTKKNMEQPWLEKVKKKSKGMRDTPRVGEGSKKMTERDIWEKKKQKKNRKTEEG